MKLLLISDTHGIPPGEADEAGCLAWLHAGDLVNQGRPSGEIRHWIMERSIPVFWVRGNHDVGEGLAALAGVGKDITGRCYRLQPNLLVAGLGWSGAEFTDLPGEAEFRQSVTNLGQKISSMRSAKNQIILLSHYPIDMSDVLSEFVRSLNPAAVVQGHVHARFSEESSFDGVPTYNPGLGGGALEFQVGGIRFTPWLPQ